MLSRLLPRSGPIWGRILNRQLSSRTAPQRVFVIGVGMTKFQKPLGPAGPSYPELSREAMIKALDDANISFDCIEAANVGYVFGESTKGQRAVYQMGRTGIPIVNCNNNCATGSTALYLSRQLIAGGVASCVMALGFEKMQKGALGLSGDPDDVSPLDRHMTELVNMTGDRGEFPVAPWMFAMAGQQHSKLYGTTREQFAKIAYKNHKHSINNPYAQFQQEYSMDEILQSKMIVEPLTKLQCSPTSDGAAAAILCNEEFVKGHQLEDKAVEILGMALATDVEDVFQDPICLIGSSMARKAATEAYQQAGISPSDAQVIELHDCFSTNELITYEALGLCSEGEGGKLIDEGQTTHGGRWVVNPSGGLISKGHPLGASGIAQCCELNWQLRGIADKRQVSKATTAIQHNLGLGGAAVVTVYRKLDS